MMISKPLEAYWRAAEPASTGFIFSLWLYSTLAAPRFFCTARMASCMDWHQPLSSTVDSTMRAMRILAVAGGAAWRLPPNIPERDATVRAVVKKVFMLLSCFSEPGSR